MSGYFYRLAKEVEEAVESLNSWTIKHLHKGKLVQEDWHLFMLAFIVLIIVGIPLALISLAVDPAKAVAPFEIIMTFFFLACLCWLGARIFAPRR